MRVPVGRVCGKFPSRGVKDEQFTVRITHRATGAGALQSRIGTYDLNGKSITWDAIVIFQIKNGKIAEEWVNRDELGVLLSAGILKAK